MNIESFYQRVICPPAPWKVSKVVIADDNSRVDVWLEHTPFKFLCSKCMTACKTYDHAPEREWRHLDTCDFPTYLHACIPRVFCPRHGVVNGVFPLADPQISLTHKMECKCICVMQECNLTASGKLMDVSWDILGGVQRRAVHRGLERRSKQMPSHMGIDEKQVFARHKYFTIITDIKEGKVYDVIDKRSLKVITPWFEKNKEALKEVQLVAMDMSAGYERMSIDYMPNAEVCFDRFHIMQIVQKAVDKTRKEEQGKMSEEERKFMFGARYDFLYGRENLPEKNKERFEKAKSVAKKTARAWAIKENLRDMWLIAAKDETIAKDYFNHWYWWATHSRIAPIKKAARSLKNHLQGILCAIKNGITNALTEGLNNKIESIKRNACGFRNKESFRTAILFHCGKLDMMPTVRA